MLNLHGLLADANIEGQVEKLVQQVLLGDVWGGLWLELGLIVQNFNDLNLERDTPDDMLWRQCQTNHLLLLTANRNRIGPTSMEAVIQNEGTPESLPVITIADATRLGESREYAERVGEALMDRILYMDELLGTGRLYIP